MSGCILCIDCGYPEGDCKCLDQTKVVDIDDHRDVWIVAKCLCVDCAYMWEGIIHQDRQFKLECHNCGAMKGAAVHQFNSEM